MNTHYTYLVILVLSLAGPLALSFDRKVAFFKQWKWLFPAMLLPAAAYIAWDVFFTSRGVWSFNEAYITGIFLANLPLEEVLFFLVVPYCCLFIYECIRVYFPKVRNKTLADRLLQLMGVLLFAFGILFYPKYYTSWTFTLCGVFIGCLYLFRSYFRHFDAMSFLVSYAIILVPFLLVNGFLTAIPVVLYNDAENLGIRIYTIPFEDTFYGMLLIMMDVAIYEKLRNSFSPNISATLTAAG